MYIVALLTVFSINVLAHTFARHRAEAVMVEPYTPLPDLVHEIIPKIPKYSPDYAMALVILYSLYSQIYIELERNFYTYIVTMLIRPIFMCVTTLPASLPKPGNDQSYYSMIFVSTHDMMFSGHTCMFIFFGKITGGYLGKIIEIIFPLFSIASRQHYTIDVLTAHAVFNLIYLYNI